MSEENAQEITIIYYVEKMEIILSTQCVPSLSLSHTHAHHNWKEYVRKLSLGFRIMNDIHFLLYTYLFPNSSILVFFF